MSRIPEMDPLELGRRAMEREGLTAKEISDLAIEAVANALEQEEQGVMIPQKFGQAIAAMRAPYKNEQRLEAEVKQEHADETIDKMLRELGVK